MTSGGVDDLDLLVREFLQTVLHDLDRVLLTGLAVDLRTDLVTELLQLVVCGRPVYVGPDESDREPLLDEEIGELPCRGGLTLTVESDEQDGLRLQGHRLSVLQKVYELLVDYAGHMLLG